jgi:hypothetical protein
MTAPGIIHLLAKMRVSGLLAKRNGAPFAINDLRKSLLNLYWLVERHEADGFVEFPQASLFLACRVSEADNALRGSSFALACRK